MLFSLCHVQNRKQQLSKKDVYRDERQNDLASAGLLPKYLIWPGLAAQSQPPSWQQWPNFLSPHCRLHSSSEQDASPACGMQAL